MRVPRTPARSHQPVACDILDSLRTPPMAKTERHPRECARVTEAPVSWSGASPMTDAASRLCRGMLQWAGAGLRLECRRADLCGSGRAGAGLRRPTARRDAQVLATGDS